MKKSNVTYGQLDKVLRAFGLICRPGHNQSPGYIYEHPQAGAMILLPRFRRSDKIYEHHLADARVQLDYNGIADPTTFEAKLQKAG
jgi:hypothetical protein